MRAWWARQDSNLRQRRYERDPALNDRELVTYEEEQEGRLGNALA
jgi:hypothetical protein